MEPYRQATAICSVEIYWIFLARLLYKWFRREPCSTRMNFQSYYLMLKSILTFKRKPWKKIFDMSDVARCMIEHFYTTHLTIEMTIDKKEVETVLFLSLFVHYTYIYLFSSILIKCVLRYLSFYSKEQRCIMITFCLIIIIRYIFNDYFILSIIFVFS